MDFVSFAKTISDESSLIQFLKSKYANNLSCPFCKNRLLYTMKSRDRRGVSDTKKISSLLQTQFSLIKIPYSKWLALVKLFELSVCKDCIRTGATKLQDNPEII